MCSAYLYDPFSLYHKQKTLSSNIRMQAKGIIKHYDFDSYIIGTSELGNTSAKEAGEKLGGKWVNLSLAGSGFNERFLVLNYALHTTRTASVIISMDGIYENDASYFSFLYDENDWNDLKAYFHSRFIKCILSLSGKSCDKKILDTENLAKFGDIETVKSRFGGLRNWFINDYSKVTQLLDFADSIKENRITKLQKLEIKDISKDKQILEQYLLSSIRKFPKIHFHLILPPYSRMYWNVNLVKNEPLAKSKAFYHQIAVIQWLVSELEKYPNATLYGFDTLEYADEIANYSDLIHYNIDMNSMQLDAIANKKHILTSQNIEEYLKIMEEKIQAYDVETVIESVKDKL